MKQTFVGGSASVIKTCHMSDIFTMSAFVAKWKMCFRWRLMITNGKSLQKNVYW